MIKNWLSRLLGIFREEKPKAKKDVPVTRPAAPARRPEQPRPAPQTPKPVSPKPAPVTEPEAWHQSQFPVPEEPGRVRFHDLNLRPEIMHAIAELGFKYCTPIQARVLPESLQHKDVIGRAQTGTGKTAAFLISIFQHLLTNAEEKKRTMGMPYALILAPTRELCLQIYRDARTLSRFTQIRSLAVYGGMPLQQQMTQLEHPVDILVATPGRLLDFLGRKKVKLESLKVLVIDEADRMLDMGFIPDVKRIVYATPYKDVRQTLFFSATISEDVHRLSQQWTRQPVRIEIDPEQVAAREIEQIVYLTTHEEKAKLLYNFLTQRKPEKVLIFANRKDETRRLYEMLMDYGISCAMMSGDVDQERRQKRLDRFKEGQISVLVATDVAGRGLHIEGMSHVINYSLPRDPEDYVHRIGRTGRAGQKGTSISFACEEDSFYIPPIEEYLKHELLCVHPPEDLVQELPERLVKMEKPRPHHHNHPPRHRRTASSRPHGQPQNKKPAR